MNTSDFMRRFSLCLLVCGLSAGTANALDTDTTRTQRGLVVGYWGTLSANPGVKIGLENRHAFSPKYTITSSISLLVNRKTDTYTSAGVLASSFLRKTGKRGFYFEHGINAGYLGSYYDFDLYRTNANNEVVNVGRKWVSSIILGYSLGVGYDLALKTKMNAQLFVKPGIFYRLPNNDNIFYLNNYSVEMGVVLHPRWLVR